MKNFKVLPVNEIGIYKDSDGKHYESKIIGILIKEVEDGEFEVRAISEFDLREGFFYISEDDEFVEFKK